MIRYQLIFILAIALIGFSCNDPIDIDFETDEDLELIYTEDIPVGTKTVTGDVTASFTFGIDYNTYLLGVLDDPYFGKSTSDVNLELNYGTGLPSFGNAVLDSIVLIMEYDTLGFYGDSEAVYDIEVRQLEELMIGDTLLSNLSFSKSEEIIGSRSLTPRPFDSTNVANHLDDGMPIKFAPQLRIPLTEEFGKKIIEADETNYLDRETLLEFINGIHVSATTSSSSMLGLALGDLKNINGSNALRIYTTQDTISLVYDFNFSVRTFSQFTHDFTGAPVEDYLADADHNEDDLAFYQGMAGVETELSFPDILDLKGKIINKADIIYYSQTLPGDVPNFNYEPIDLTTVTYINDEGNRVLTTDASIGLSPGPYTTLLGGAPEQVGDTDIYKHRVSVTTHLSNVLNNDDIDPMITLTPLQRSERSSRTIIFGAGDAQYKPVLQITYTNL